MPRRLRVDGLFCFDDVVSILETYCDANDWEKPSRGEVFVLVESYLAAQAQERRRERVKVPGAGMS
jgi:hypothetical protein